MNSVNLIGRLAQEPELKQTQSGIPLTTISVAVQRPYKSQGEDSVDFFDVLLWRQSAEYVCKYAAKGCAIGVTGRIQIDIYNDRKYPDVKHKRAVIVADRVELLSKPSPNARAAKTDDMTPMPPQSNTTQQNNGGGLENLDGFEDIYSNFQPPF